MLSFNHTDYPLDPLNPVNPGYLCITKQWATRATYFSSESKPIKLMTINGRIKEFKSLTEAALYAGYKNKSCAPTALRAAMKRATADGWFDMCGKKYKAI